MPLHLPSPRMTGSQLEDFFAKREWLSNLFSQRLKSYLSLENLSFLSWLERKVVDFTFMLSNWRNPRSAEIPMRRTRCSPPSWTAPEGGSSSYATGRRCGRWCSNWGLTGKHNCHASVFCVSFQSDGIKVCLTFYVWIVRVCVYWKEIRTCYSYSLRYLAGGTSMKSYQRVLPVGSTSMLSTPGRQTQKRL